MALLGQATVRGARRREGLCLTNRRCACIAVGLFVFITIRVILEAVNEEEAVSAECQVLVDMKLQFLQDFNATNNESAKGNFCGEMEGGDLEGADLGWERRGQRPINEYDVEEFFLEASRRPSRAETTIAVQLSIDRLDNLDRLGRSWEGHVSAAVYIPYPRIAQEANDHLSQLQKYLESVEAGGVYFVDIGVVFGLNGSQEMKEAIKTDGKDIPVARRYKFMYPVNVGRNLALAQVRTDFTFLLDVDFVVSEGASLASLGHNPNWKSIMCLMRKRAAAGKGTFAVIPAFEIGKGQDIPKSKSDLVVMYSKGQVQRMSGDLITHCPTNYGKWMQSDSAYVIQWGQFYEPYGIAPTALIPWYPDQFKGYHLNKIMIYFTMAATGWDYVVLPEHFVAHVWHEHSDSRGIVLGDFQMMNHIHRHRDQYLAQLGRREDTCSPKTIMSHLDWNESYAKMPIKSDPVRPDGVHFFKERPCITVYV